MNPGVTVGLCPIGKFVFSNDDAIKYKKAIQRKLKEQSISFIDLDDILEDGLVKDQSHVNAVVDYFSGCIDALFVPHCNFGTEGAVGMIAHKLGVPVLLWGPRDESPLEDGSRLRDSLCGMFASSKVLGKLKVPFTYIENCSLDDQLFSDGLAKFVGAAGVVKSLRNMRIGQLGVRIDFFWTTIVNESELLENFGIEVQPFDMCELVGKVKERAAAENTAYDDEVESIKEWLSTQYIKDRDIRVALAYRDELLDAARVFGLSGFSIQSFDYLQTELGPGSALGDALVQEVFPIAPESDIHGAIGAVMLASATQGVDPIFSPEFTIRHPSNDNAILLWHASAPPSLRSPADSIVEILPPWILKDLPATSLQYRLKNGPLTICRFDGDTGNYVLGLGEGKTVDGPATREIYTWMEVDNWPVWERKIIEGPYIHHCAAAYDHCADVLEEACKYIPGLKSDRFDEQVQIS
ncbi:MAG: fucose isomerase [Spirochaetales bacterium]|nr:fucose isomerase [Spirochaetales bacterium]